MAERDNFYILLELDPSIKDEATINKRITEKQQQWSRDRNHPTKGTLAQQNLSRITDIKRVMSDQQLRDDEARAAVEILQKKEEQQFERLYRLAALVVVNDEITETSVKTLAKKVSMSEKDVFNALVKQWSKLKLVKEANPTVEKLKDDGIKLLEDSVMNRIRADLKCVKKKDLFDFLGMSPTSSCAALVSKADELYTKYSKNANKTAEVTASVALATCCKTYLKDKDSEERYLKSQQYESFGEIKELIDLAVADNMFTAANYQKIIRACTDKGISLDRAEFFIIDYCVKRKYPTPQSSSQTQETFKKQIQCGNCGHLNEENAQRCTHCGSDLYADCPKCKKKVLLSNRNCPHCGFAIGDMLNALPLLRDAKLEIGKGNYKEAAALCNQAEMYWPGHPDIVPIRKELDKEKDVVTEIDSLVAAKRFLAARKKLSELQRINATNPRIFSLDRDITDHIKRAEEYCRQARATSDSGRKLDLFLSALEECSDMTEALSGASAVPVDPPISLTVSQEKNTAQLRWTPPTNNKGVQYKVVRKAGSAPKGDSDGVLLATVENPAYNDTVTEFGVSYYYAVYSVRGNNVSFSGVKSSTPVLFEIEWEDVSNLKAYILGDRLYVEWDFPTGCESVKIEYAYDKYPNASSNIEKREEFTKEQYQQNRSYKICNLEKKDYYIRVYACYLSGGNKFFSHGKNVKVDNHELKQITYYVKSRLFNKKTSIVLKSKDPFKWPSLDVVAKSGGFPLSRTDGKCIKTIPAQTTNSIVVEIPYNDIRGCQIRIFFTNDTDRGICRLISN